ncbi:MAG: DNA-3-methyladenine glycosylase I [Spirochaetes bacterium]|nr:DNA-3-methyladenine glycosylase I [Spirochaetota bacterium]
MSENVIRCGWVPPDDDIYRDYHDLEWGVPVHDDRTLFEFLILEGAQAGLSWRTILVKRDNYRKAFDNFDAGKIASYDAAKIESLMNNPGIIRNKLKINSAVRNAALFIETAAKYQSFANFIWKYTEGKQITNCWKTIKELPVKTELSDRISNDLKKLGFKFVGSTIIYSYLQAVGIINDHTIDCFRYEEIKKSQRKN